MAKKKSSPTKYLIIFLVIGVAAILGYGVYSYFTSGADKGIIVCNPQNPNECYWQAHIHTYVMQNVCGDERKFDKEHGDLEEHHTHEETNIIHWHDRTAINKETGELDSSSLTLGAFMEANDITFTGTCFYEYCNGDTCPDRSAGTMKMFVKNENGNWQQNEEYQNYVWQDKDIIYIAFDSRAPEEILEQLQQANMGFPILGTG